MALSQRRRKLGERSIVQGGATISVSTSRVEKEVEDSELRSEQFYGYTTVRGVG